MKKDSKSTVFLMLSKSRQNENLSMVYYLKIDIKLLKNTFYNPYDWLILNKKI